MSTAMAADSAISYLETLQSSSAPSLHPALSSLHTLARRKLWHQLTLQLQSLLKNGSGDSASIQIELFNNFIAPLQNKFDKLRLAEMAVGVSQQYDDANAALAFLNNLKESVKDSSVEAYLLLTTEAAHFSLLLNDLTTTTTSLNLASKTLDTLDNVPSIVHGSFYRVSGDLHKSKAEYGGYYKNSLLYLACINDLSSDLSKEERVSRAHDLGIAALLGDSIYNFGELLMHPILEDLKGTQWEWLHSLLYAFNSGSIGKFESLLPYIQQEPILASSLDFLRPKICLMSLIDLIFRLPSSSRTSIPLSTIASETKLPLPEVEYLIMKALSLNLCKGEIDQVDSIVNVKWVQPRVLDLSQIEQVGKRLDEWSSKVRNVGERTISGNQELMVQ